MKRYICLILTVCALLSYSVYAEDSVQNTYFDDIAPGSWYEGAVNYCYEKGIVKGMTATSFKPESPVTRGMFVTILGRFSGVEDAENVSTVFTDVPANEYYSAHVKWAYDAGVINGISPTTFAPEKNVSRQDMCVMIRRYCNYMGIELTEKAEAPTFTDEADIALYAKESIYNMLRAGLVNGMGSKFNPKGTTNRAQAATIMMRLDELASEQEGAMRLIDQKTGVVVEYTVSSGITSMTELNVKVAEGLIQDELAEDKTYTISFTQGGQKIAPQTTVKVKIPLRDGAYARDHSIFVLTEDNVIKPVPFTIENGYYTFDFLCDTDIYTGVQCWTDNY